MALTAVNLKVALKSFRMEMRKQLEWKLKECKQAMKSPRRLFSNVHVTTLKTFLVQLYVSNDDCEVFFVYYE